MDEDIKKLLSALLTVAMENRSEDAKKLRKSEKMLNDIGLQARDIASILDKSPGATIKAIQRSRKK